VAEVEDITRILSEKLSQSQSLPFLFIGSGMSRRYLGTPDWENLLRIFAKYAKGGDFAYEFYQNRVPEKKNAYNMLPAIASLIEKDFNEMWFSSDDWQESRNAYGDIVKKGQSTPFKIEIANFFKKYKLEVPHELENEIDLLRSISSKNIAGIITTNYDLFLESIFDDFKTFVGQDELLFSPIQGVAETYKIHGCCSRPETIVLNQKDYQIYTERNVYLAAKLLTFFVEHPVVFLGYSISDENIRQILNALISGLDVENVERLSGRLFFVERSKQNEVNNYTIQFEHGKSIHMTRILTDNFDKVYDAIKILKSKYPTKMLRRIKDDLYQLILNNDPENKLFVTNIDDDKFDASMEYVVGVGVFGSLGDIGFKSIQAAEIYRDIVLNDAKFGEEIYHSRIVTETLPSLLHHVQLLPMYKYLQKYKGPVPDIVSSKFVDNIDSLLSNTLIGQRSKFIGEKSINGILAENKESPIRALKKIPLLIPNEINIDDLQSYLTDVFYNYPDILTDKAHEPYAGATTDLRRVIRIFDWIKYGKTNMLPKHP